MAQEQKQMSFQEYVGNLRNSTVIAYDQAKEVALRAIDDLTAKLIDQVQKNEASKSDKPKSKK